MSRFESPQKVQRLETTLVHRESALNAIKKFGDVLNNTADLWITVFGFPAKEKDTVLKAFGRSFNIVNSVSSRVGCLHLQFGTVQEAQLALKLNCYFIRGLIQIYVEIVEGRKFTIPFSTGDIILKTAHWGQENQDEINERLLQAKPSFAGYYSSEGGGLIENQTKLLLAYEALSTTDKLKFHYCIELAMNMMKYPAAQEHFFNGFSRTTQLSASLAFANTKNDQLTPQCSWIANDGMRTVDGRPSVCLSQKKGSVPAAKLFCQMHGVESLTDENKLQASHPCGDPSCLVDCVPESPIENQSRNPCREYGCASTCPHDPICLFQDDEGHPISCRNDESLIECQCGNDCFEGVDSGKAEKANDKYQARKLKEGQSLEFRPTKKVKRIVVKSAWVSQSRTFTVADEVFGVGQKGGPKFYFNRHSYNKEGKSTDKFNVVWTCSSRRGGRASTVGDEDRFTVTETKEHSADCKFVRNPLIAQ